MKLSQHPIYSVGKPFLVYAAFIKESYSHLMYLFRLLYSLPTASRVFLLVEDNTDQTDHPSQRLLSI